MSPDTSETRLRLLEGQVARLEQHMSDIGERLAAAVKNFDDDIRTFGPLVKDVVELQRDILYMRNSLSDCSDGIRKLREEIEKERGAREKVLAERDKRDSANRKWTIALAVTILFGFAGLVIQIVLAVTA